MRPRYRCNALKDNRILGWAEITHPYHPLLGKKFPIVNEKQIGGIETLFLKGTSSGTFPMPKDWTDQVPPPLYEMLNIEPPILKIECLLKLVDIVDNLDVDPGDLAK